MTKSITKTLFGCAVALAMTVGVASAQSGGPPPAYNMYNWTGFYVGGHAGYGWDDMDMDILGPGGFWGPVGGGTNLDDSEFLGGGQIGYWHQTSTNFVFGVDISGSATDLEDSVIPPFFAPFDTWTAGVDWFLLVQGRLGWAMDRWLFFVQGGYAGGEAHAEACAFCGFGFPIVADEDQWHSGYTVGAGVLFKVTDMFSIGGEYNFVDLGDETYNLPGGFGADKFSVNHEVHVLKVTGNFHFTGPW